MKTKSNLRGDRRHALNAWLGVRGTQLDEALFWKPAFRTAEEAKFAELDAKYEADKAQLALDLKALTDAQLQEYFEAIPWTPVGATKAEKVGYYIAEA